jgi:RNA polymerase sigma-70 factor (ECF subfamily)|tara:strand:- start:162 stop:764 length:603 start_codon:yes stop_codon:yes gene_type:complete
VPIEKALPTTAPSDQQLVERVQAGDKRAFDLLVLKYQHKIISLVGRYVKDHHEAMDVSQEAFIKAYRALANFRGDSQFYTWLYRIAINTAKNYLVARNRRPPDVDVEANEYGDYGSADVMADIDTPENLMARDQLQDKVFATLEKLPDDLRTALTLREFEGMSYEQIAEVMDCPVGTVRSRIFRARDAIDKEVAKLMDRD